MTASCRVNVNNIHIPKPSRIFVKPDTGGTTQFILGCPTGLTADRPAFAPLDPFGRTPGGRSKTRYRENKSILRLRADLRLTSAACGAPHRHARTATPRRATSTRYAAPSSSPADAACPVVPARQDAPQQF